MSFLPIRFSTRAIPYLVFVLAALGLALVESLGGGVDLHDIDDMMRAVEVQRLFEGQGFYDLSLPMIAMPGPYIAPWSRLVDIPYVVLGALFAGVAGADAGLRLAFLVWPPLMLCGFAATLLCAMRQLAPPDKPLRTGEATLALLLLVAGVNEFAPGRIDHHNVQMLLVMTILCGISVWSRRGACLAGVASVLSVAVGLEMLPLVALVMLAVAMAFVFDGDKARGFARGYAVTVLVMAPLSALLLLGPDGASRTSCDAYSAPYVSGFIGYGLGLAIVSLVPASSSRWMRLALLGLAGAGVCGGLAFSFQTCLAGPYVAVDGLTRSLWLDQIRQEHSAFSLLSGGDWSFVGAYFAPSVLLLLLIPALQRRIRLADTRTILLYAVAVGLVVLGCLQLRFGRFMGLGVAVLFPLLLRQWRDDRQVMVSWLAASTGAWVAAVAAIVLVFPSGPPLLSVFEGRCKNADLSVLHALPPGRFLTPPRVGMAMLPELSPGQSISSVPFHRAAPGIHRALVALLADDPESRAAAFRPFDYVALCPQTLPDAYQHTVFSALLAGKGWPGVFRIDNPTPSNFRVYRIDHTHLR
ncbi:hypothetical protein [Rhizobium halophytocola]|uniref:Glycosyltransferase RgtA/B/C/D-like domain-containing protein n=1 Tax=Rhizobium halophytocola TaxID=735519 RepID=A0ABS4E353_9HYPH|nr:hypothetical protein [Rhizobium halophytocola]MBP1852363.1 hypothetical protein [Rhizobium halophytocola]